MNGRFFGACFFIFGAKRSCCAIDDYSPILQQPLPIEYILLMDSVFSLSYPSLGGYSSIAGWKAMIFRIIPESATIHSPVTPSAMRVHMP